MEREWIHFLEYLEQMLYFLGPDVAVHDADMSDLLGNEVVVQDTETSDLVDNEVMSLWTMVQDVLDSDLLGHEVVAWHKVIVVACTVVILIKM